MLGSTMVNKPRLTTEEMIKEFEARGGKIQKCNTHAPLTGQMRYNFTHMRQKALEEGKTLDELPYYLLDYKERRLRLKKYGNLHARPVQREEVVEGRTLVTEEELCDDAARTALHRIGRKTIREGGYEGRAREIIYNAEAVLQGELTRGQRRDLLKDNTDWSGDLCDAVEEFIFVNDNPPF